MTYIFDPSTMIKNQKIKKRKPSTIAKKFRYKTKM